MWEKVGGSDQSYGLWCRLMDIPGPAYRLESTRSPHIHARSLRPSCMGPFFAQGGKEEEAVATTTSASRSASPAPPNMADKIRYPVVSPHHCNILPFPVWTHPAAFLSFLETTTSLLPSVLYWRREWGELSPAVNRETHLPVSTVHCHV